MEWAMLCLYHLVNTVPRYFVQLVSENITKKFVIILKFSLVGSYF